ncbi:zinc finger protein 276 isoform X4 [Lepidochelys kempii]|uniref:zinc finger protein 276 isoform X4 n=1 Tax=Lepidochelys kempii TaxID=8472 RepID=UPI003C6F9FD7
MKRDRRGRFLSLAGGRRPEPRAGSGRRGRAARGEAAAAAAAGAGPGARGAPAPPEPEDGAEEAGIGRALSTGYCRLCHGKFSSRSLRNAFGKVPVTGENSEKQRRVDQVFFTDFQRLVGVAVRQDPALPQYVCKKCHAQFYKCRSILKTFIQRVNASPTGHIKSKGKSGDVQPQPDTEAPCLGQLSGKQILSSTSDERVKDEFSDLSEGDFLSEDENDKRTLQSSDDSFEPYPEKKGSNKKSENKEAKKAEEPKIRKKPGPKPGWKKKIKCEREELPTIYKCPYQGCTAVYRGADGMKKHIKEHHEEVRERPCPHPGCNKVFMIDRYLQRHVKLIHTEVRNYICDECGQTFKQRKHLSVHQMRHSGAKPLQCEICGFQCRQRASLKYHMTKHKAETELEFACDQCGKRFEKAHNLNVHMSMVHPLTQTQDKAKPLEPEQILMLNPSGTVESQAVKPELTAQQEPT